MICPNCGANNIYGSSFCIKCGLNLKQQLQTNNVNSISIQNEKPMNNQPAQTIQQQNQPIQQQSQPIYNNEIKNNYEQSINNVNASPEPLNYLMYIIGILTKPFKQFKEEESKLNNPKNSFILALIITVFMTIINLFKIIFSTVRVASYSWTKGYTYEWQWDNLKNIKWIEVIGKNFLIYVSVIFLVALVFYLGSLIIKKQLSFIKSLSITATSVIPAVFGIMILSPLGGMIWSHLSIIFSAVGGIYTLIILYELINNELQLEGDKKVYFNLICFGIIAVAGYYAFMKLFTSSISSGFDNLLDLFN